ncbi:hypothetical protein A2Y85_07150 [candidate division WOR-3 bacterium RBG_13_43_14]|uniref:Uncharacterized protein n=1 Tax=candidate division WOR-3 bacterium RBG_13_43_14 TaxID=1802590 RepID=A0A1F4UA60_UNCW3|nr:MAG: hypothetical protein A2Y85_07150 [candidate division WOR-3 bacterium RBG_13_43_14]
MDDRILLTKYYEFLSCLKEEIKSNAEFIFNEPKESQTFVQLIEQGRFYYAIRSISKIIEQARSSLIIIDRYYDDGILDLIPQRDELKEIKLLTDKVSNRFKKFAEAFNKESKNLYVRAANAFHDRYIITDINQFWYLGSSIDKHLGSKYTIFMLISEPLLQRAILEAFELEWQKANEVIKPNNLNTQ